MGMSWRDALEKAWAWLLFSNESRGAGSCPTSELVPSAKGIK